MTSRGGLDADVLIVGGGVAGVSLLHALSSAGVDCLLIDAHGVGASGASSLPAALLNPHRGRTGRASVLDREGLGAVRRLVREVEADGYDSGARFEGVVRVASSARQAAMWSELAGPRRLTAVDVPPHVNAPFGGMLIEEGGWLEPGRFLAALSGAALDRGARVIEHTTVRAVHSGRTRGTMNAVTDAGTVSVREVVLAPGAYDAAAMRLPFLEHAPGLAASFDLSGTDLHRPPDGGARHSGMLLPLAGSVGIAFVGTEAVVSGSAHHGDERDVERLRTSAAWFVPALRSAPLTAVWRGVRARRPSGVPVTRRLRSGVTLFGGFGGRGFLCAPLLARRLALRLADVSARTHR